MRYTPLRLSLSWRKMRGNGWQRSAIKISIRKSATGITVGKSVRLLTESFITAAPKKCTGPAHRTVDRNAGRMVVPIGDFYQDLIIVCKTVDGLERQKITDVRFVPMTSAPEQPSQVQ